MSVKMIKYKIESQVTSPKLTIAMAAQLLYCCRRSGEKFVSETPVNNHVSGLVSNGVLF